MGMTSGINILRTQRTFEKSNTKQMSENMPVVLPPLVHVSRPEFILSPGTGAADSIGGGQAPCWDWGQCGATKSGVLVRQ